MRPTTGAMLQENNNNNHHCLSMSAFPQEMLQKCSKTSLPFPSRVELGLGDLPLIRGLRAWALCSKNRRKAGSLLGVGKAPAVPPPGRGTSTSCQRPADVYLSGYGPPLGLDARQAGIGALVTVATLKTSEGGGKTQTQCLFLRTEKGSCLYSTARPGSVPPASMVGEWLRGKRGTEAPPAEAGATRVRSDRRWRKSGITAGRERKAISGEQQRRSCRKAQADGVKPLPSKSCTRGSSRDEPEGAEGPTRGAGVELNSEEKEASKEEEGRVSDAASDASNYTHRNSNCSSDVDGGQETKRDQRLKEPQTSYKKDGCVRRDEDGNAEEPRKPEEELKQNAELETEMKSSLPVEGGVSDDWYNQLGVEPGPEAENDAVKEEGPDSEESNSLQEEKGVLRSPVRRRDLSICENSEGKREDGRTCSKRNDGEERRSGASGRDWREKEGDTSARAQTDRQKSTLALNPAPSVPPLAPMATSLPCQEEEEEGEVVAVAPGQEGGRKQERSPKGELEDNSEEARGSTVATEEGGKEEEEEEEDEFGVFMQAEEEGVNMSASVPCGSRGSTGESRLFIPSCFSSLIDAC